MGRKRGYIDRGIRLLFVLLTTRFTAISPTCFTRSRQGQGRGYAYTYLCAASDKATRRKVDPATGGSS